MTLSGVAVLKKPPTRSVVVYFLREELYENEITGELNT